MPVIFTYFFLGSNTSVNNLVVTYLVEGDSEDLNRNYLEHDLEIIVYQYLETSYTDVTLFHNTDEGKRSIWSAQFKNKTPFSTTPTDFVLKNIIRTVKYPIPHSLHTSTSFHLRNLSTQFR